MRKKCTSIGGQAVIEGVMMRGPKSIATAVRDEKGNIVVESNYLTPIEKKNVMFRTPIVRGFLNFGSSMVSGMKTLLRSGEVFGEDAEPSKFETWLAKKFGVDLYDVVMTFSVILGVALSLFLFFFLPQAITSFIQSVAHINISNIGIQIGMNFLEGFIRILIFVVYIWLTTLMPDVKRTYMYHGAEHKTISCYEHDLEMTVENAKKMTTVHDRCGTTFMFIVMVVSVLVFSVVGWQDFEGVGKFLNSLIRFAIRIALIPVVAGVSYEILKLMAKYDNWLVRILKAPGLLLQRLTTKEPTDDMLEVAIVAFKTVLQMEEDPNTPVQRFDVKKPLKKVKAEFEEKLKAVNADSSEVEWILSISMGIKRSELALKNSICESELEKAKKLLDERLQGKPLWRIVGDIDFYNCKIIISDDVLSPRPETEELCEIALNLIKDEDKVLDLCTGSGCIAVAIAKNSKAKVCASDVSKKALETALKNVNENQVSVELIESDLFEEINQKYNIIISNPPYIPTKEIDSLDKEVKNYDPMISLDGGEDGLKFYRLIASNAASHLEKDGYLLFECGENQAQAIKEMLIDFDVEIKKDFSGIDRFIVAKLKG